MSRICDVDEVLALFGGCSDADIDARWTIENALYDGEVETITTKQVKYYDEDEAVWKIGEVIVNDSEKPNNSARSSK